MVVRESGQGAAKLANELIKLFQAHWHSRPSLAESGSIHTGCKAFRSLSIGVRSWAVSIMR
jgi:uncharacterized FlgJ-related protein